MSTFNRKHHWDTIYKTKALEEVSWYQPKPETSLAFFKKFKISKTAKIIDVGGGDSFLVDHLVAQGYTDLTVLDISAAAIERAKKRLGEKAKKVKWMVADAAHFTPEEKYDFWHDRAAFHFLTDEKEIAHYLHVANSYISENGIMVIGTFSEKGPKKCSGIAIRQYSEASMNERLKKHFKKVTCLKEDHNTPFGTVQNFIFCSFRKM